MPSPPTHTRRLRPPGTPPDPDTTDYELSPSVLLPPAVRLVDPDAAPPPLLPGPFGSDARALFQQRLRLCCWVAAGPFLFFFVASVTGFIDLFSRNVVGYGGVTLAGAVLVGLLATGAALRPQGRPPAFDTLRAVEIGVFGVMTLFFAYWQFALLVATPFPGGFNMTPDVVARQEQYFVLAAALVAHFNWFALLVFHGVLVPNTISRGVGVAGGMIAVALAVDLFCVALHDPTRRNALVLLTVAAVMLVAGALLSIFGTAKTAELRQEVESAMQAVREMGQYRLRRKLGAGGMGEVYLAEHRLLKRPCALKRIHPKYLNNEEQVRRFEREVQTTAKLRHPNTVEVYDYGRAEDGTFYYVMEYLPGVSLEDLVGRHGPLSPARAVHFLRQVCGALKEAHRAGLVHRDLKPSNVLVVPDGATFDHAKLVDFGLVQSAAEDGGPSKITRDGLIVGTPEYMSPEQAQGLALDERSDLFSLGSVAYYLLTGKEAFHRENAMKSLLAVVNEEPKRLADVNPFVPADVAAVVAKCLAKAPAERFARAAELDAALAACGCSGVWSEAAAAEWWDRHPRTDPGTGTDLDSLPMRERPGRE